jgi:nucleoside-triphosphatase
MDPDRRPLRLFLTGPPRCGKTTLLMRLASAAGPATGFYTEEVREGGRRVGFRIRVLGSAESGWLSSVRLAERGPRVGAYTVSLAGIEGLMLPAMRCSGPGRVVLIDEIGKMECLSAAFREALLTLLDSPCHVVATIALRGGAFIEGLKARPGVRLVEVGAAGRERLAGELSEELRGLGQERGA